MNVYHFDDKYFNLEHKGCSTTTWTWDGLKKIADDNGIVSQLDCEIDVNTKVAKEFKMEYFDDKDDEFFKATGYKLKLKKIYTGNVYQLE